MRRISTLTATLPCSLLVTALVPALVLTSLELAPTRALAQEPSAGAAVEDPKLAEAQTLYNEGETKFQTGEYDAALGLWKRAFAIVGNGEDTRAIRNALVYNIAEAHNRAYEVSRNPTHLRTAKLMLDDYRKSHRDLYGDDPEAVKERAEADERIAELDTKIAASEAKGEVGAPLGGDTAFVAPPQNGGPLPPPKPLTPNQQWEQEVKADPVLGPQWEKGGKQVGGGAVLVGIGGVFALIGAGLVAWGFSIRADYDPTDLISFNGTGAFVSGGVFGVIGLGMLIPGAVLIGSGASKRKGVTQAKPKPSGMFVPIVDPSRGRGGVAFTLRF